MMITRADSCVWMLHALFGLIVLVKIYYFFVIVISTVRSYRPQPLRNRELAFNYYIFLSLVLEKTIQRRISDSVDFDRDWDDYVNGFGEVDGNYWIGLEEIHQLTTTHDVSLYINIERLVG